MHVSGRLRLTHAKKGWRLDGQMCKNKKVRSFNTNDLVNIIKAIYKARITYRFVVADSYNVCTCTLAARDCAAIVLPEIRETIFWGQIHFTHIYYVASHKQRRVIMLRGAGLHSGLRYS